LAIFCVREHSSPPRYCEEGLSHTRDPGFIFTVTLWRTSKSTSWIVHIVWQEGVAWGFKSV